MNHYVKETLMGHKSSLGLDIHYYRTTDQKILTESPKVVYALTVNKNSDYPRKLKS
ncbi:MAG: hypothetical protein MRJ93_05230 [Nitrososphaeraceae archaeon]|nr:hypothetical protein [Nitrososphaeraceae archaeon]